MIQKDGKCLSVLRLNTRDCNTRRLSSPAQFYSVGEPQLFSVLIGITEILGSHRYSSLYPKNFALETLGSYDHLSSLSLLHAFPWVIISRDAQQCFSDWQSSLFTGLGIPKGTQPWLYFWSWLLRELIQTEISILNVSWGARNNAQEEVRKQGHSIIPNFALNMTSCLMLDLQ